MKRRQLLTAVAETLSLGALVGFSNETTATTGDEATATDVELETDAGGRANGTTTDADPTGETDTATVRVEIVLTD